MLVQKINEQSLRRRKCDDKGWVAVIAVRCSSYGADLIRVVFGVSMAEHLRMKSGRVSDTSREEALGKKIRRRRREMDMTLRQLADIVGLSIGFLSQIERGASTPSLSSLCNIAGALETNIETFVNMPRRSDSVSRLGERNSFNLGDARRTYELLGGSFADAKLHPTLVRRPAGHVSEIMHNEGEDFVYVLEGCMLLELNGERHIMNRGDSMHFHSHLPHRCATIGTETVVELWVRTKPLLN